MRKLQRIGIAALVLLMIAGTCVPMADAAPAASAGLSFREAHQEYENSTSGPPWVMSFSAEPMPYADGARVLIVERAELLSGADVTCVGLAGAPDDAPAGGPNVRLVFDGAQRERLAEITTDHVGDRIAIVLNGKVLMAPTLQDPITGGEVVVYGEPGWDAGALRDVIHRDAGVPLCTGG